MSVIVLKGKEKEESRSRLLFFLFRVGIGYFVYSERLELVISLFIAFNWVEKGRES